MIPSSKDVRSELDRFGNGMLVVEYYASRYSDERVNDIRRSILIEYAHNHLNWSESNPTTDWVRRVLFEVDGNEDACIEECIHRLVDNQLSHLVKTKFYPKEEQGDAAHDINFDDLEKFDREEPEPEPEGDTLQQMITDIAGMAGRADISADVLLSCVETFRDYVLENDHVLGDHRVALTLASLVKSNYVKLREIACPLLLRVPPSVLKDVPLVAEIHASVPTAVQVTETLHRGDICYSLSILGFHKTTGVKKNLTAYVGDKQWQIQMYVPSKKLGDTIANGINHLIGKRKSFSRRYTTKKELINAIAQAIRDMPLLMSAIQRASREVAVLTFSDFDIITNFSPAFKTAVSPYPIPQFARLLLLEESGKISEIVLLLVLQCQVVINHPLPILLVISTG